MPVLSVLYQYFTTNSLKLQPIRIQKIKRMTRAQVIYWALQADAANMTNQAKTSWRREQTQVTLSCPALGVRDDWRLLVPLGLYTGGDGLEHFTANMGTLGRDQIDVLVAGIEQDINVTQCRCCNTDDDCLHVLHRLGWIVLDGAALRYLSGFSCFNWKFATNHSAALTKTMQKTVTLEDLKQVEGYASMTDSERAALHLDRLATHATSMSIAHTTAALQHLRKLGAETQTKFHGIANDSAFGCGG